MRKVSLALTDLYLYLISSRMAHVRYFDVQMDALHFSCSNVALLCKLSVYWVQVEARGKVWLKWGFQSTMHEVLGQLGKVCQIHDKRSRSRAPTRTTFPWQDEGARDPVSWCRRNEVGPVGNIDCF